MFKAYIASEADLAAINEALKVISSPKLNFIFSDRSKIENTLIISFDSKFLYVWEGYRAQKPKKIAHKLKIKDEWQHYWVAGILNEEIERFLPKEIRSKSQFELPRISGGLLKPFVTLQKSKRIKNNPYVTRESYLATIIHEFGHIYWNQHKLWWFSDKKKNIEYLIVALDLYKNKKPKSKSKLIFPARSEIGELFAYCTEYYASSQLWLKHKKSLDKFAVYLIDKLVNEEMDKNLEKADSTIELSSNPHNFALVFGKIILANHQDKWLTVLTQNPPQID